MEREMFTYAENTIPQNIAKYILYSSINQMQLKAIVAPKRMYRQKLIFNIYIMCTRNGRRDGGVCVYVKDSLLLLLILRRNLQVVSHITRFCGSVLVKTARAM